MPKWGASFTEAQLAAMSARNKAAHIKGAHQNDDNPAKASHPARDKAQLAETRIKAARIEAILRAGGVPGYIDMPEGPPNAPTPVSAPNPAIPKGKRTSKPSRMREAMVLAACQAILEAHPAVALWWRQNTGAVKFQDSRYVKFSFKGAPDLMGLFKGGRFFCVECKATGKSPNAAQQAFLDNVRDAGGLPIWTDDPAALMAALDHA